MFDDGVFVPQYSFLGVIIAALILVGCFVLLTIYFIVPHFKKRARGFNVNAVLKKLDKDRYKLIKRLYFENYRRKNYTSNVIVSNFGIFIFNAHDEVGRIFKNDKGKFVAEKEGAIHVLGDYEKDNLAAFQKIKNLSPECAEAECFSMVVFPDAADLQCTGDFGFFGHLKDALAFIRSKNNDMGVEKRDAVYSALSKENSKNMR